MLIALSTYLKPLSEVDQYATAHRAYLQRLVDAHQLLICGRQQPPLGGVLIAHRTSKETLTALLEEDPYVQARLAKYRIIEFKPGIANAQLLALLETLR